MEIDKYYLDLEKVNQLESKREKDRIHEYYKEMLFSSHDGRTAMSHAIFLTLFNNGFLKDTRDEKIKKVLGDDSINS